MPLPAHSLLLLGNDTSPEECGDADAVLCGASLSPGLRPGTGIYLTTPDDSEETLRSIVKRRPTGVALTNCHAGADVQRLDVLLSVAEADAGVEPGTTSILAITDGLLPPPLSPAGFVRKSRRLVGLVWDWQTLAQALGAARCQQADGRWTEAFAQARVATLVAAKAAGIAAYEVVPPRAGMDFEVECLAACADGFDGRATADAGQIATINAAFKASD